MTIETSSRAAIIGGSGDAARASEGGSVTGSKQDGAFVPLDHGRATARNCAVPLLTLVDDWVAALEKVEGREPRTCKAYRGAVGRFVVDLGIRDPAEVTRAAVERHVRRLAMSGIGRSRLASVVVALRAWCRWMVGHGIMPRNPLLELRPQRPYRRAKRPLSIEEVKRLVLGGGGGALPRSRDELVSTVAFALCYGAALRPGEVAALKVDDIEWHEEAEMHSVLIAHGKHADQDRIQAVGGPVSRLLGAYLDLRRQFVTGTHVFPGSDPTRPITDRELRIRFHHLAKARGIERKGRALTPKILRTSRCTHLLAAGHNPRWVQQFMRHSSIETTMEHYAWTDDDSGLRMLRKGDPLLPRRRAAPQVQGAFRALLDEMAGKPRLGPGR